MSLVSLYIFENPVDLVDESKGRVKEGEAKENNTNTTKQLPQALADEYTKQIVYDNLYLNMTAKEEKNEKGEMVIIGGNMTEWGFLKFLKEYGFDISKPKNPDYELPFDST